MIIKFIVLIFFYVGGNIYAQPSTEKNARESSLTAGVACKTLGYRWGYTARATMLGNKTKPEWDFSIPMRCRGKAETEDGIRSGVYAASK